MRIIVDGFGGDNAPLAIIEGCALAVSELDVDITIVGNEDTIRNLSKEHGVSLERMTIATSQSVVTMEDDPTCVIKDKADSSMAVGLKLLADGGGDAFITAGSTGAAVVGGTMIVKRIKGIKRPALAVQLPTRKGNSVMALDIGANVECRPSMLTQFGVMGSAYMNGVAGVNNPRVALVNNGTEETKGNELVKAAYAMFKDAPVNFIGNIEAREINNDASDVVVCDGFTGNIILKLTEGLSSTLISMIKEGIMGGGVMTKLGGALITPALKGLKKQLDYTEYGGAPLLGLRKPVFKAHGSSGAKAIKSAVAQAVKYVNGDVTQKIVDGIVQMEKK